MFKLTKESLEKKSDLFRYTHFLITGLRFQRFSKWRAQGKRNPFVSPSYERKEARRSEFVEFFTDFRSIISRKTS
ncbi:MAG: hypothetical protein OIF48_20720 [Silicimonas sp.]|nr:hypothetical protein [Silicimonas sp.]